MGKRKAKRKRMGRPSLGADAKKVFVGLRVSKAERAAFAKAARAAGLSLSAYILAPHRKRKGARRG